MKDHFKDCGWECEAILTELDASTDLYFDRVSQIKLEKWSQGRVALIGDAAFCVSLLAGQGSALAMTAAYVLAGELAKSKGDHEIAFRRYECLLRPFMVKKQEAARTFAGSFAPKTRFGLFVRNQVMKALRIPGLAKLTVGQGITNLDSENPTVRKVLEGAESLTKSAQRLLLSRQSLAQEFSEADISPHFRANGSTDPNDPAYISLAKSGFEAGGWRYLGSSKHS